MEQIWSRSNSSSILGNALTREQLSEKDIRTQIALKKADFNKREVVLSKT